MEEIDKINFTGGIMSIETGEGYKPPGAEEWESPKTGTPSPESDAELQSLKQQVEQINQQFRSYDKKHSDLILSSEAFSNRTLSKLRHAVENIDNGDDKSKGLVAEYSKIMDTLTQMTPELQKGIDFDRMNNQATADFREREEAQFRTIYTDKALGTFLIDRAKENGFSADEIDTVQKVLDEKGVRANRADRILDELGKYRTLDKEFMTPKPKSA